MICSPASSTTAANALRIIHANPRAVDPTHKRRPRSCATEEERVFIVNIAIGVPPSRPMAIAIFMIKSRSGGVAAEEMVRGEGSRRIPPSFAATPVVIVANRFLRSTIALTICSSGG
jgi:hypothetical protein